ncbi:hypothetical protein H0H92_007272 [Tricholoma furcatifolium]|nr:hypothetical protein H0H92_007272 [Tricholoma furcatifolium]
MQRVNPISKLFRKNKKNDPVVMPGEDVGDDNLSPVPSRGANVPAVLGVFKTSVKVASTTSSLWPPLQAITSILEYFIDNHEAWLKNQKATVYLVDRLKGFENFIQEGGVGKMYDSRFAPRIRQLECDLQDIKNKATMNQYMTTSEIADALNEIVKDIGDVILDYQTALQKAILEQITQQTIDLVIGNRFVVSILGNIEMLIILIDDQKIIHAMHRVPDANHLAEKHAQCLPGTRTDILLELEAWARDSDPKTPTVYWLNGIADSGKSTICQSFCHQAFADGRLGASFFCSRDTEARSNLDMIFPTLSFQLACHFPEIRSHIVEVLKSCPDVAKESLFNKLEALLLVPLEQSSLSILIVIDALDECKDSGPTSILLSLLSHHIQRIPHVKWFITGCPEPPLRQGFRTPGLQPITKTFILHDVTAANIDHDISFYLSTHLSKGLRERSGLDLPEIWPPDNEIQALTIKCNGLFIFASTAVTYIQRANFLKHT